MWMPGNFGVTARTLSSDVEHFVARLDLSPAICVLDVACGTGNTALPRINFDLPTNPAGAVHLFGTFFGPTYIAFNSLNQAGQAAFSTDLEVFWVAANEAPNPAQHTLVRNEYLQIPAILR